VSPRHAEGEGRLAQAYTKAVLLHQAPSPLGHVTRPPFTCIVYPHRASAPPLATASLPAQQDRSWREMPLQASQRAYRASDPRHVCITTVVYPQQRVVTLQQPSALSEPCGV
jgi:hypothetical protein